MMADSPPEMCPEGDLPFVDSNGSPNCSTPTVNKEKSPLSIGDDQCVAASSGASDPSVGFSNATSNVDLVQLPSTPKLQSPKTDIEKQHDMFLKSFELENISSEDEESEHGSKRSNLNDLVSEESFVRELNVADETYATSIDYSSTADQPDKEPNTVLEVESNDGTKDDQNKEDVPDDDDVPDFIPQAKLKLTLPPLSTMGYDFQPDNSESSFRNSFDFLTETEIQITSIDYKEILAKKNNEKKQSTSVTSEKSVNSSQKKGTNGKNKDNTKKLTLSKTVQNSNTNLPLFKVIYNQCIADGCNLQFQHNEEFMRHLVIDHDIWIYRCFLPNCNLSFASKSGLQRHFDLCHPNTVNWKCSKCPLKFGTPIQLFHHNLNSHYKGLFVCVSCNFSGHCRQMIINHFTNGHGKNSHKRSKNSDQVSIPPPPPPPPSNWRKNPGPKRPSSPKLAEPYVPMKKQYKAQMNSSDYRGASMSSEWNYHPSGPNRGNSSYFGEHSLNVSNPNANAAASSSFGNFYHSQSVSYSSQPPFPMNYGNQYQYGNRFATPPPTSTVAPTSGQQTSGPYPPNYNPWPVPGSNSTPSFNGYNYYSYGHNYGRY